ncbi:hypothetical protein QEB19_004959 [Escherichia coli]|nr:hypothetical protein [Escherichia coli]
MKIFIVLVGKNKKRPVAGAPLRTINLLRKNWISAGELYQLCEEAPQLPDNRQRKGHLSRWPFDTNFALSPTHEHRRQCHICGWWAKSEFIKFRSIAVHRAFVFIYEKWNIFFSARACTFITDKFIANAIFHEKCKYKQRAKPVWYLLHKLFRVCSFGFFTLAAFDLIKDFSW